MSMSVQPAPIAAAPTPCVSTCLEATGVSAGVVTSLQMTGTLASVSAKAFLSLAKMVLTLAL